MWYNRFKEGREDINEVARPGRPSTSTTDENNEAVKKMTLDNRRITDDIGISVGVWWFKEGREDVNDDARPGHSSTSKTNGNIEAVKLNDC